MTRAGFKARVGFALLLLVGTAAAYDWDRHLWQDRLLFVVAPSAEAPGARAQLAQLHQRDEAVRDRRLRVIEVYRDTGAVDGEPLTTDELTELRARLSLGADEQSLILVGLDGGVKRRAPLDTELREIFVLIDGMPMRQAEIRDKRAAGQRVTDP
jgi:hypothetical protein